MGLFKRIMASCLSLLVVFAFTGLSLDAKALVISTDTTWIDPSSLNDSLIINPGVTLRILNGNALDGGDLIINLPDGGLFQIQSGGFLNLNGLYNGGRSGDLTVNLTGPSGNIDISGVILAQGLGTGRGGIITLNGSSFNLPSTGVIYANSPYGLGGNVTLNNSTGAITVDNGFRLNTTGQSDATHNLISITGTGVNVNGILNANGTLSGSGSSGGSVKLLATGVNGHVDVANNILAAGTKGKNGGLISIRTTGAGGDVIVDSGGRLVAASASGGSNAGNGGSITLNSNDRISINSVDGNYVINVNGSDGPTVIDGNGTGGSVIMNAAGDIDITATTAGSRSVIEANGARSGTGSGGLIQIQQGNTLTR